jgi:hypothetical protein
VLPGMPPPRLSALGRVRELDIRAASGVWNRPLPGQSRRSAHVRSSVPGTVPTSATRKPRRS